MSESVPRDNKNEKVNDTRRGFLSSMGIAVAAAATGAVGSAGERKINEMRMQDNEVNPHRSLEDVLIKALEDRDMETINFIREMTNGFIDELNKHLAQVAEWNAILENESTPNGTRAVITYVRNDTNERISFLAKEAAFFRGMIGDAESKPDMQNADFPNNTDRKTI